MREKPAPITSQDFKEKVRRALEEAMNREISGEDGERRFSMKHFWSTNIVNGIENSAIARITTMIGRVEGAEYKVETVEYSDGHVTSVFFVTPADGLEGEDIMRVTYMDGKVDVSRRDGIQAPEIDVAENPAGAIKAFVVNYAEQMALAA